MTYQKLQRIGEKIHEQDFFQDNIYLGTSEVWIAEGSLFIHEYHSNQMQYTGENTTRQLPICEAKYTIREELPKEAVLKCRERLGKVYWE